MEFILEVARLGQISIGEQEILVSCGDCITIPEDKYEDMLQAAFLSFASEPVKIRFKGESEARYGTTEELRSIFNSMHASNNTLYVVGYNVDYFKGFLTIFLDREPPHISKPTPTRVASRRSSHSSLNDDSFTDSFLVAGALLSSMG